MIKPNAASREIVRDMAASAYSPFIPKLSLVGEEIRILEKNVSDLIDYSVSLDEGLRLPLLPSPNLEDSVMDRAAYTEVLNHHVLGDIRPLLLKLSRQIPSNQ